ncbi:MAG: hypothetical protein IT288_18400 [Bdellovibrionales bacterium]|nr:hypothetical protein [Bdellovibrionales bacterium]
MKKQNTLLDHIKLLSAGLISLSGVLATIVYHAVAHFCSWLVVQKADTELKLREKYDYILRESEDLRLQHLQSIGAIESKEHLNSLVAQVSPVGETALTFREELKDLLKDLKNIDVTVGSCAENVTTRLESFIDKSVGERLAELLESQRASTERIASEISQVLGKSIGQELEKSFRDLAERLPAIVSGGAGDATRKMAEAVTNASASFETVAQSMPELITGVSKMLDQLHLQQQQSATASIQMNQDLMKSVKQAIESLAETSQQSLAKQSEMVNLLGEKANILASQTSDATKGLNIAVEAGTNSLSKATQDISGRVSEIEHSLGSLLSKVQQSNQDLLNNFNYSIEQFRGLTSGMSQSSSQIREVVTRFAEVAKNLEQAPISSKQLIDATSSAINSQNQKIEQYIVALASGSDRVVKTLVDEYERGVEKIAETFKTKIAGIEKETENIRKVYMSAGAFMADTAEVFETLTESVDGLNQTLTKQASKIGG